jgi:hypothetical protein
MPTQTKPRAIVVEELVRAWEQHEDRLKRRRAEIGRVALEGHPLPPQLERERAQIDEALARKADPVITAVWDLLGITQKPPEAGVMPSQRGTPGATLEDYELRALAVYWGLVQAGHKDSRATNFEAEVHRRATEYEGAAERFQEVARRQITPDRRLSCADVHDTVRCLVERGQEATDETVQAAYDEVRKSRRHRDKHDLSLGRLSLNAAVDLVPDHLRAAAIVYAHNHLDRAGVLDAVARIVDDADYGRIDIRPKAIERIEEYRRHARYRWVAAERLEALRNRLLGPPFPYLWRELITATHDYVARLTPVDLIGSKITGISQEPVRVAALALATHSSENGWGTTYTAAEALRRQMLDARRIVNANSIIRAYCSRDWLGVVTRAADVEVSAVTREFALAEAGTTVFSWLGLKAEILEQGDELLDIDLIGNLAGNDPLESPTDGDFATACEQLFQLLGYGHAQGTADEETDSEEGEEEGEDDGGYAGHGGYRQPGVFTLKPSMFANGGEQ